jgi:hypothetical protein
MRRLGTLPGILIVSRAGTRFLSARFSSILGWCDGVIVHVVLMIVVRRFCANYLMTGGG